MSENSTETWSSVDINETLNDMQKITSYYWVQVFEDIKIAYFSRVNKLAPHS